jgi:hypothetical protein
VTHSAWISLEAPPMALGAPPAGERAAALPLLHPSVSVRSRPLPCSTHHRRAMRPTQPTPPTLASTRVRCSPAPPIQPASTRVGALPALGLCRPEVELGRGRAPCALTRGHAGAELPCSLARGRAGARASSSAQSLRRPLQSSLRQGARELARRLLRAPGDVALSTTRCCNGFFF